MSLATDGITPHASLGVSSKGRLMRGRRPLDEVPISARTGVDRDPVAGPSPDESAIDDAAGLDLLRLPALECD